LDPEKGTGTNMNHPAFARPAENLGVQHPRLAPSPRRVRIGFRAGAWHLSEDGADTVGGIFTSLSAAVAFGRDELRGVRGAVLLIELDGGTYDGRP
jgi:hypothetical protein